jgi:signal transduction histidine kinase/ligand-binding sensor domain-containing protein
MKLFTVILSSVLVVAFSIPGSTQIQDVKFTAITGTNEITLGKINCVIQDKYGFMWLSDEANQCIIRFDGSSMTRFKNDPMNPNSLGGTYPETLAADTMGNIWIGFYGMGLDYFNSETETFTHFRHDPQDPSSLSSDTISTITIDHLGGVWVGTNRGLNFLDLKTGKFAHYVYDEKDPTSLSDDVVRSVYEDRTGTLWIGTGVTWDSKPRGGLNRFNRQTGKFTRYLSDPHNPHTLVRDEVRAIFEDSRGTLWIGTAHDGLHTMDRKTGLVTRVANNSSTQQLSWPPSTSTFDHITFINEDHEQTLWIGTFNHGIIRYNPVTGEIAHFGNQLETEHSFKDNSGWCAYVSNDGLIWVSTQSSNLFTIDIVNNLLTQSEIDGVRDFYKIREENDHTLLFGTQKGLVRKDFSNGKIEKFQMDPIDATGLKNAVQDVCRAYNGRFWIGTPAGLYAFDPMKNELTFKNLDSRDPVNVISICQDNDSTIWVGTLGSGLFEVKPRGEVINYRHINGDKKSISSNVVSDILRDNVSGDLWVGTADSEKGLNRISRNRAVSTYLVGLNIYELYQDAGGTLWAGTQTGLYRYDVSEDNFYSISDSVINFESPFVRGIIEDDERNLWVSTEVGIFVLNEQRNKALCFGKDNGIDEAENFAFGSVMKRSNGDVLFGSHSGYYNLNPRQLPRSDYRNPLYLTEFRVDGRPLTQANGGALRQSIMHASRVSLNHDQNVFSIKVNSIDFRNQGNAIVHCKLENFDVDWHTVKSGDRVQYFKVPPGSYTFRAKIANNATGEVTEKTLFINISPPWWNTTGAYIAYTLLLLGSAYSIQRIQKERVIRVEREKARERELEQKKEIEKAYTELKTTQKQLIHAEKMASLGELTAGIAHEIQNPLNFVNNFSEVNFDLLSDMKDELSKGNVTEAATIASTIAENEQKILHHGKRAELIVKSMLQHSRSSSGQKEPTDINSLADEYLRLAYHGLRAKVKNFNVRLETEFDPRIGKINVDPQDIGRVLLNLINNALYAVSQRQLTSAGNEFEPQVSVKSKLVSGKVVISVSDNGIGIREEVVGKIFQPFFTTKPPGQGTGLGLSLSYDIITKGHGGELKVDTAEGRGSTFTIILPV